MQVLYLSVLTSVSTLKEVQQEDTAFVSYAVHKFNRLIVEGLAKNNVDVCALSTFYLSNKRIWYHREEHEGKIKYRYVPCINAPFVRHLWLSIYCFFYTLIWGFLNKKHKALVCDVLNVSACTGAVYAARLIGLRRVGIMTDMPGLMLARQTSSGICMNILRRHGKNINKRYLTQFTHYVFLTEQMSNVINKYKRPYIVMEGLVYPTRPTSIKHKDTPRTIFYAGGLHARYGLKMLVDAVKLLPFHDIQLVLYGDGPFVEELEKETDPRIVFRGTAPNDVIVEAEQRATLLVNPRPTHEEFTKYSFPSKNMEYMLSGTPLLTTRLPGMPAEYYPYVYLFDEECVEGYAHKLYEILNLSPDTLRNKGESAREFVLVHKSNTVQTKRILDLIDD